MPLAASATPRIVVTTADPSRSTDADLARRKIGLYVAAIERHGGEAVVLDESSDEGARSAAFESMRGLLLTGGADLDPGRYGRAHQGAREVEAGRDALEVAAWEAAQRRALPVFGICRGFQAINVFTGGTLLQHVGGHDGPAYGSGPARSHAMRVAPGTRLARILFPTNARGGVLRVNSYHHQAVRAADLARGLVASGWSASPAGEIVEGLEASDGRFLIGVQCHPERTESTPAAFERLFSVFVDAARGPIRP